MREPRAYVIQFRDGSFFDGALHHDRLGAPKISAAAPLEYAVAEARARELWKIGAVVVDRELAETREHLVDVEAELAAAHDALDRLIGALEPVMTQGRAVRGEMLACRRPIADGLPTQSRCALRRRHDGGCRS